MKTLDKDFLSTAIYQLWKLLSGPFTMVFITLYLTEAEQGYWYTFGSLSALSVFADLGFTTIMLQFSAHEFANLSFTGKIIVPDSDEYYIHLQKLGKLFRFILKWVVSFFLISFPIIFGLGVFVFSKKEDDIVWFAPWLLFIIGSGISFINQGFLSFFEGCNQVAKIQIIRFVSSIIQTCIILTFLIFNLNIWALGIASLFYSFSINIMIQANYSHTIRQLWNASKNFTYHWGKEFFPLFWRYAISWASGYFIFQIFTPLAFDQYGAEFAGKIGLTMALINAGFAMCMVWFNSVMPRLNILVSTKNWIELDRLFKKRFFLGLATYLAGFGSFFLSYLLFYERLSFFQRFLPPFPMGVLLTAWLVQYIVSALAIYMRIHKEEPLVWISLISGIFITVSTFFLVFIVPADYMFLGFLTSQIIFFVVPYRYYRHYRTTRHI